MGNTLLRGTYVTRALGILIVAVFFLGVVALAILREEEVGPAQVAGVCLLADDVVGEALSIPVQGYEQERGCTYQQTAGGVGLSLAVRSTPEAAPSAQALRADRSQFGSKRTREVRMVEVPVAGTVISTEELTLTGGEIVREIEMHVPRRGQDALVLTLLATEADEDATISLEALTALATAALEKIELRGAG